MRVRWFSAGNKGINETSLRAEETYGIALEALFNFKIVAVSE